MIRTNDAGQSLGVLVLRMQWTLTALSDPPEALVVAVMISERRSLQLFPLFFCSIGIHKRRSEQERRRIEELREQGTDHGVRYNGQIRQGKDGACIDRETRIRGRNW